MGNHSKKSQEEVLKMFFHKFYLLFLERRFGEVWGVLKAYCINIGPSVYFHIDLESVVGFKWIWEGESPYID